MYLGWTDIGIPTNSALAFPHVHTDTHTHAKASLPQISQTSRQTFAKDIHTYALMHTYYMLRGNTLGRDIAQG